MTETQIIEKINHFLAEEFEVAPEKIKPDAQLKETLELDSLDYIDLAVVIEHNLNFKVKPEDFTRMITVQDFYNYAFAKCGV
ncbi:acyl carrier protein [Flavihumibacter sp. UBA7668]|uniref:acyl carrier protein n=1 Tax=Flavihumibacter sp. UBA7668 TaxID=1946542 RepID=UPI0025BE6432|nr:acyl carrier protein [Flavihumibacter sp. UBA7668]